MSTIAQRPLTAEELRQLPGDGKSTELVRGEAVKNMPPGIRRDAMAIRIAMLLSSWAQRSVRGAVIVKER